MDAKITKGEWKQFHENSEYFTVPREKGKKGAKFIVGMPKKEDAKACSAVPEMIEALKFIYHNYYHEMNRDKAKEALEKAGVDLG